MSTITPTSQHSTPQGRHLTVSYSMSNTNQAKLQDRYTAISSTRHPESPLFIYDAFITTLMLQVGGVGDCLVFGESHPSDWSRDHEGECVLPWAIRIPYGKAGERTGDKMQQHKMTASGGKKQKQN